MKHASVFSGIGGPEVAAAMLGWENLFHCEINPFGREVLEFWFPNSVSYEDITKTDFTPWRGKVDVLTGGFPCQPFSYAGRRKGRDDERYLWPHMHRVINEVRPAWVVCENVGGITTMVEGGVLSDMGCYPALFQEGDILHGFQLEETFTIERICEDLEADGYSVQPLLIPAAAVGAPHRRDRVFIVAHASDSAGELRDGDGIGHGLQPRTGSMPELGDGDSEGPSSDPESGDCGGCYPHHPAEKYLAYAFGIGRGNPREYDDGEPSQSRKGERGELQPRGADSAFDRWREFPTVSPVHRGNDGIPFPLDDLTISITKWRTESLKAYGNAIVPQVMYRIFQAIQSAE